MIAVECFPDEALLRAFGIPFRRIKHAMGKGNVLNCIMRSSGAVWGVVDEDPGCSQPAEIKNFTVISTIGSLTLMKSRTQSERQLVVIHPRLEEWLIGRAGSAGVKPADYGLPDNPSDLHAQRRYDRNPRFKDFLHALLAIDPEVQQMKMWLCER